MAVPWKGLASTGSVLEGRRQAPLGDGHPSLVIGHRHQGLCHPHLRCLQPCRVRTHRSDRHLLIEGDAATAEGKVMFTHLC